MRSGKGGRAIITLAAKHTDPIFFFGLAVNCDTIFGELQRGTFVPESQPTSQASEAVPPASPKWFHFRGRVLLLIPVVVVVLAAVYVPRQFHQKQTLAELKAMNAQVRTQPLLIPGVERLFGKEYSQEILDVYIRNPELEDSQLQVVTGLRTLQKLELAGSSVSSDGLRHLTGLPNLYILHLADTNVTDEGLVHLEGLRNLGILSLDRTGITDDGLARLELLPRLERLFLDDTAITDAGIAHVAKLSGLKELSCVNTAITDDCLKHLEGLKDLEVLKVYNTKITRDALEDLHKILPNCMIWEPDE